MSTNIWNQDYWTDKSSFINGYLFNSEKEDPTLINGSMCELQNVFNILNSISTEDFINILVEKELEGSNFSAADVPCFSTMLNGMLRLPELLEFYPEGMTFQEIGYQMKKQKNDMACIKYGENHAKLAAIMSLVTISKSKPAVVAVTSIGHFLIKYEFAEKAKVLKALLLRDPFVRFLVKHVVMNDESYADVVSFIKPSTAYRRMTSVKQLVVFVLENTRYKNKIEEFKWMV